MIEFFSEDINMPDFNQADVCDWINTVIENHEKKLGEISIIFCSDDYILKVNREYLNHDYFTDIITFDYCEGSNVNGDLFISLDTVLDNSRDFDTGYENEIMRVIIHGILHLIGFNDKTDSEQEEMTRQENISLSLLIK